MNLILLRAKSTGKRRFRWTNIHEMNVCLGIVFVRESDAGAGPGLAQTRLNSTRNAIMRQQNLGLPPVLLVQHSLRAMLARYLRRSLPQLKVFSYAEVPDTRNVKVVNLIGG
jgi:flagellar biosynthesis component FlhA